MKRTALLLSLLLLTTTACQDYPKHEPSLTDTDLQKSGPGLYGGIDSPTNNNTDSPTPTTTPTS